MADGELGNSRTNLTIELPDNDEDLASSGRIAYCIQAICDSSDSLNSNIDKVGTSEDNVRFRAKILNDQLHVNRLIESGSEELNQRNIEIQHDNAQQRLELKLMVLEFRKAVENYVLVQREMAAALKDPIKWRDAAQHQLLHPNQLLLTRQLTQQDQLLRHSQGYVQIMMLDENGEEEPSEANNAAMEEHSIAVPNWHNDDQAEPLPMIKQNAFQGKHLRLVIELIFAGLTIIVLVGLLCHFNQAF